MLNNDVPSLPHYLTCALMNLKHVWMRSMGILCVYLTQWLSLFFMLVMLFFSLNYAFVICRQAYKDFLTRYMN